MISRDIAGDRRRSRSDQTDSTIVKKEILNILFKNIFEKPVD